MSSHENYSIDVGRRGRHETCDGWVKSIASVALVVASFMARPSIAQTEVQIFLPISPAAWAFYLAEKKGYFEEEGIKPTIRVFNSGGEAGRAFHALDADMLEAGDLTSMAFLESSAGKAVTVGQVARVENGIQLIAPVEIKGPEDLRGRRIATNLGASTEYFLQQYLRRHGLDDEVKVINLDPGSQVPALIRGDVDAIVSFLEVGVAVLSDPRFHLVDGWSSSLLLNVSAPFLASNGDDVEKVLRALNRAALEISGDSDKALAEVSGAHGLVDKAYLDYLEQDLDLAPQYTDDTHDILVGISDLMVANKRLDRPFDFCRLVALEPLRAAYPDRVTGSNLCN
jgi:ABC-type nitrate/sulfonate/bicarbonate transport system substrate-binding protein